MIFNKQLIKILNRKGRLKEVRIRTIDKLKKNERLTKNEFRRVYASIRQEGPEIKYRAPLKWIEPEE